MTRKIDALFFVHIDGGGENHDGQDTAFIVRDMADYDVPIVIEEMEDTENFQHGDIGAGDGNYQVNGVVELAPVQTHFTDTAILAPTRFLVFINDSYSFLDEVPVFKRPQSAIEQMEEAANTDLEHILDEERAEGEGMYKEQDLNV